MAKGFAEDLFKKFDVEAYKDYLESFTKTTMNIIEKLFQNRLFLMKSVSAVIAQIKQDPLTCRNMRLSCGLKELVLKQE